MFTSSLERNLFVSDLRLFMVVECKVDYLSRQKVGCVLINGGGRLLICG